MKTRASLALILMLFNISPLIPQSISGGPGNQSCSPGGEMWVCGGAQISQASSDFDTNCAHMDYEPCSILRVIVDVCSPNMRTATISEPGDNCEVI